MQDDLHITEAQAVYLEKFLHFQGSIASFAAEMDVPLVDMIDILSAKPVKKRLKAASKLTKIRRNIIAAEAEITALQTLQQIAANRNADIVERRRAASNILRAIHKPRRSTRPRRHYSHKPPPPDDPDGKPTDQLVPQSSCTQEVCVPDQTAQNAAIYCPQELINELQETRNRATVTNKTEPQAQASGSFPSESPSSPRGIGVPPVPASQSVAHASSLCESQSPPSQNRACQEATAGRNTQNTPTSQEADISPVPTPLPSDPPSPLSPVACGLRPSPEESHPFNRAARHLLSNHDPP